MSYGCHIAKNSHILSSPNKKRKTILEAIQKDTEYMKLGCAQIFVQGPRNSHMAIIEHEEIVEYCNIRKINLYVHSSYITVGIFSINPTNKNTEKSKTAITNLLNQLEICDKLKSRGFVIHLSKKTPDEIIEAMSVIIPLIKSYKTPIVFEQPAKKPDDLKTYETAEKINKLTELIMLKFPKFNNWYWCIDTCHLWSAGIELNNIRIIEKWIADIKYPKKIGLFHLNGGSSDIFNTGKDKHIVPFSNDDDIWKNIFNVSKKINNAVYKKSSIYPIIQFCKKNNIDSILEINRGSVDDIYFVFHILNILFNLH
jgi:endonuclease IV